MQNGRRNAMKRKIFNFMMVFYYRMACRSDKKFKKWCRRYTELALKQCRKGGDSDAESN